MRDSILPPQVPAVPFFLPLPCSLSPVPPSRAPCSGMDIASVGSLPSGLARATSDSGLPGGKMEAPTRRQAETVAEWEALLPVVFGRAHRGRL